MLVPLVIEARTMKSYPVLVWPYIFIIIIISLVHTGHHWQIHGLIPNEVMEHIKYWEELSKVIPNSFIIKNYAPKVFLNMHFFILCLGLAACLWLPNCKSHSCMHAIQGAVCVIIVHGVQLTLPYNRNQLQTSLALFSLRVNEGATNSVASNPWRWPHHPLYSPS